MVIKIKKEKGLKNKEKNPKKEGNICIVGLGYVGLPLAVAFSRHFHVIGFDVKKGRIEELKKGIDITNEVEEKEIKKSGIKFTCDPKDISKSGFIIVAVPTPITAEKRPDLGFLESASKIVGENLSKNSIVVFESTVYPGVTEETCMPIIEKYSGLKCGRDWKIGYSPERINPGDKKHSVENIVKVVSAIDNESLEKISAVYSKIVKAGIHKAPNIKTAEAAKVIENIQRDLNIALMNELSIIFGRMGINTRDVLEAAATKWNFHKYHPGLVGGHCIGIDPYYLTYKAQQLGYSPKVILAGRDINDSMPEYIAEVVVESLRAAGKPPKNSKILLMGLTFKEDVPDIRNSKAKDLIRLLEGDGINVAGFEPLLKKGVIKNNFGIENVNFEDIKNIDCIVLVNAHKKFKGITLEMIKEKLGKGILIDIKNFYDRKKAEKLGIIYKSL